MKTFGNAQSSVLHNQILNLTDSDLIGLEVSLTLGSEITNPFTRPLSSQLEDKMKTDCRNDNDDVSDNHL